MLTLNECIIEYKKQLDKGLIQKAYLGLMEYILRLKAHFKKQYPDYFVSGGIYFGYMDMTYFSFMPASIKDHKLKVAIVFEHEACRFEAWLGGYNKKIQKKYWELFKESSWEKYPVVTSIEGRDAIIEHVLVNAPDFDDLDGLTDQIERGVLQFIREIEEFLIS
jgi:hypothetical protein